MVCEIFRCTLCNCLHVVGSRVDGYVVKLNSEVSRTRYVYLLTPTATTGGYKYDANDVYTPDITQECTQLGPGLLAAFSIPE